MSALLKKNHLRLSNIAPLRQICNPTKSFYGKKQNIIDKNLALALNMCYNTCMTF